MAEPWGDHLRSAVLVQRALMGLLEDNAARGSIATVGIRLSVGEVRRFIKRQAERAGVCRTCLGELDHDDRTCGSDGRCIACSLAASVEEM